MKKIIIFLLAMFCLQQTLYAQGYTPLQLPSAGEIANKIDAAARANEAKSPKQEQKSSKNEQKDRQRDAKKAHNTAVNIARNNNNARFLEQNYHSEDFQQTPNDFMQNATKQLSHAEVAKVNNPDPKIENPPIGVRSWEFAEKQWNDNGFPTGGNYIEDFHKRFVAKKFEKPNFAKEGKRGEQKPGRVMYAHNDQRRHITSADVKVRYGANHASNKVTSTETSRINSNSQHKGGCIRDYKNVQPTVRDKAETIDTPRKGNTKGSTNASGTKKTGTGKRSATSSTKNPQKTNPQKTATTQPKDNGKNETSRNVADNNQNQTPQQSQQPQQPQQPNLSIPTVGAQTDNPFLSRDVGGKTIVAVGGNTVNSIKVSFKEQVIPLVNRPSQPTSSSDIARLKRCASYAVQNAKNIREVNPYYWCDKGMFKEKR